MQYCVLVDYGCAEDDNWTWADSPAEVMAVPAVGLRFRASEGQQLLAALEKAAPGDVLRSDDDETSLTIICCKGD